MKITNASLQQSEYLAKVASGRRLEDIAKEDHVSARTVVYHLNGLKASMQAETLPQLVAKGIQTGIIQSDDHGGFMPGAAKEDQRRGHMK